MQSWSNSKVNTNKGICESHTFIQTLKPFVNVWWMQNYIIFPSGTFNFKYGGKDGEEMWQKCRIDKNVD